MTDFLSGLKAGLAAHDQAEADKREIAAVIADLARQTRAVSGDAVTVSLKRLVKSRTLAELFDGSSGGLLGGNTYYTALCFIRETAPASYRELATWGDEEGGYPVMLRFDGQRFDCHDRASLEETLVRLVQTATAGKALAELAELAPEEESERPTD